MAHRQQVEEARAIDFLTEGVKAFKEVGPAAMKAAVDDAVEGEWSDIGKLGDRAQAIGADIMKGVLQEGLVSVFGGVRDAAQGFLDTTYSLSAWLNEKADLGHIRIDENGISWRSGVEDTRINLPDVTEGDTVTGGVIRDMMQFLTGFIPALHLTRGIAAPLGATALSQKATAKGAGQGVKLASGLEKMVTTGMAGALSDATVFDPAEKRLSDFLRKHAEFRDPVTDYLASDPNDSEAENRFKRALEGFGLGAALDGFFMAVKLIGSVRHFRKPGANKKPTDTSPPPGKDGEDGPDSPDGGGSTQTAPPPKDPPPENQRQDRSLTDISPSSASGALWDGADRTVFADSEAFGMVRGFRDGLKTVALQTGSLRPTGAAADPVTAEALDRGGAAVRAVDLLGAFSGPFAADAVFRTTFYRMALHAHAFQTARNEGLQGKDLAARIGDILDNPPPHIRPDAIDTDRMFAKSPTGSGGPSGVLAPFLRNPADMLKHLHDPSDPLLQGFRTGIAAGGAERDLALGRLALGGMTLGVAADLTAAGLLTGGGPSDPGLKRRNGTRAPYSVKIGARAYTYNRHEPFGRMLGLAADTSELIGQHAANSAADAPEDLPKLAAHAGMALGQVLTSRPVMTGFAHLLAAIDDPGRYGGKNPMADAPFPADQAPLRRWEQSVTQVRSRTPGFAENLPPRRTVWGAPVYFAGASGAGDTSAAEEEMIRLRVPVTLPPRHIRGVALTPQEYDRFVVLSGAEVKDPNTGKGARESLNDLVCGKHALSPVYHAQTDGPGGGKALMIQSLVKRFRDAGSAQLLSETPALRKLVRRTQKDTTAQPEAR